MTSSEPTRNDAKTTEFAYVEAVYEDHPNPEYKGNPLISALPFYLTDDELIEGLELLPKFSAQEREHDAGLRRTYIGRLSRCVIALPRTVALARCLLDLMLEGYVGREPFLPQHRQTLQRLYEGRKKRIPLEQIADAHRPREAGAELSTAFIGASGCGKSTTVKRIAELLPPVICHDDGDMWQVPVLIFELPPDGRTVHGLATAIIDALAKRLPLAGYAKKYLQNVNRKNAYERIYDAASLIQNHRVGLLIADESQKQKPSDEELKRKEDPTQTVHRQLNPEHETPLISLLITASNKLGVPLVLVGTNELHDVLHGRFSKRRRGVGHGTEDWLFLERSGDLRKPNEFEALLRKLWKYQWVQKVTKLSADRANLFFQLTQGNPDIMVKLFASAQRRAIRDGVEELTDDIIREAFKRECRGVHEPLDAHEQQDPERLVQYLDIAPVELRAGKHYAKVAAEMNESNYKRKLRAEAAARRRAKDEAPPIATELSGSPGVGANLKDALPQGISADDGVAVRLAEAGVLATKHDAV